MNSTIQEEFKNHIKISQKSMENLSDDIEITAKICIKTLKKNGKIIIFGNGGSAADSQHIAAELVGRYKSDRKGLAAISLSTDTSAITAISNDFGYENVFKRQIEAIANIGDTIIGISTSGKSKSVINALIKAKNMGCNIIGFSGKDGGEMNNICNVNIMVPSNDTPRIQEMHILIGHTLCHIIEQEFIN
jgi:D-sedoheptulose 7-phosphate isomerase